MFSQHGFLAARSIPEVMYQNEPYFVQNDYGSTKFLHLLYYQGLFIIICFVVKIMSGVL